MPIRDLLRDKAIVLPSLRGDERVVTEDFVRRRVSALIAATPSLADPAAPRDITKAATPGVATTLKADVPKVKTAHASIWKRVEADVAKGLHVDVTPASLLKRVSDRPPAGDAALMRKRLVFSIVYQSCAADMTLADPANIDRLHKTCDRRLRIVERMLYDVGRHGGRAWDKKQIKANPSGPWVDGTERAFEYPRVPRSFFFDNCNPGSTDICQAPMTGWKLGDDKTIMGPLRTNPATTARWTTPTLIDILEYTHPATGSAKPIDAIRELFTPSKDFLQRNQMYCDHTIHALHIEALIFSEMKRRAATDTAWFDNLPASKGQGWLRLSYPITASGTIPNSAGKYLVGSGEPAFFEHVRVRPQDLQVGDHLIVYNHPAYEFTTLHGAWRLENAIVVQTAPDLRVQGHGSPILTLDAAKAVMLDYFRTGLDSCRAALQPLAGVVSNGTSQNTVVVDDVSRLRDKMHIDIVERTTEVMLADKRVIQNIDARKRIVTYSGPSVTASAKHVLRRRRFRQFKANYESIELEAATSPRTIFLLRRVAAAASTFAPAQQLADWYVTWIAAAWEEAVRVDPKKAAFVKTQHLIEYTREDAGGGVFKTVGWLPLYEPAPMGTKPVMSGGKIAAIKPLSIGARHIAAWGWFADPDVNAAVVTVVRPKVV